MGTDFLKQPQCLTALETEAQVAAEIVLALAGLAGKTLFLKTPKFLRSGNSFTNLQWFLRLEFAGAGSCTLNVANPAVIRHRAGVSYA